MLGFRSEKFLWRKPFYQQHPLTGAGVRLRDGPYVSRKCLQLVRLDRDEDRIHSKQDVLVGGRAQPLRSHAVRKYLFEAPYIGTCRIDDDLAIVPEFLEEQEQR